MVFNSYTFLLFFGVVVALHYSPLSWRAKKLNLLVASYIFYAAWNPPFVILLWISTVIDWFLARWMHRSATPKVRKGLLFASLGANLGMLAFFKYSGFLLENFILLADAAGIQYRPAAPSIILPVGISFYTFQTLSYTLDVYRRQAEPWHSFLDYCLYVTFFPQLVAGPIVRAVDFLPQARAQRPFNGGEFGWGLSLLILGLFEKIVLADGLLAPITDRLYNASGQAGFVSAWTGTLAFAGQIFFDFAGYTTCAVGAALCLGFGLPDNFRFPYAAVGFSDFWRRWHLSLSTWLRDYLYISLGGNRGTTAMMYRNLLLTMLLGGLWHGAAWTFVIWGGMHGLFLVAERPLRRQFGGSPAWVGAGPQFALGLLTFALVCFTWVFFRAQSFSQASMISLAMLGIVPGPVSLDLGLRALAVAVAVVGCLIGVHWFMRARTIEQTVDLTPWWIRSTALALMMCAIVLMPGDDRAFIYFQF